MSKAIQDIIIKRKRKIVKKLHELKNAKLLENKDRISAEIILDRKDLQYFTKEKPLETFS